MPYYVAEADLICWWRLVCATVDLWRSENVLELAPSFNHEDSRN